MLKEDGSVVKIGCSLDLALRNEQSNLEASGDPVPVVLRLCGVAWIFVLIFDVELMDAGYRDGFDSG
jgi:hypothetical protein